MNSLVNAFRLFLRARVIILLLSKKGREMMFGKLLMVGVASSFVLVFICTMMMMSFYYMTIFIFYNPPNSIFPFAYSIISNALAFAVAFYYHGHKLYRKYSASFLRVYCFLI
uniref:Uncharacterized protein n=1 Tax=Cacopsylla melanoneura TaxID=428564 RepID=A0A8D8RE85_9HEMI